MERETENILTEGGKKKGQLFLEAKIKLFFLFLLHQTSSDNQPAFEYSICMGFFFALNISVGQVLMNVVE